VILPPFSIPWTWTRMSTGDKFVLLLLKFWQDKLVCLIETNTLAYLAKYFALSFACSGFSLDTPVSTELIDGIFIFALNFTHQMAKYKLLCFITTKFFCKEKNALAFNWDRCCHLVLCIQLIPFH